jgi:hypothetical protein
MQPTATQTRAALIKRLAALPLLARQCAPADPLWPFAELTQDQRLARAKQEARMRAGALRGLPSVFGELS